MRFIEHIIEPTKLLLAWQASDEQHRFHYIVGELNCVGEEVSLTYLSKTNDFAEAQKHRFEAYPAFQDITKIHHNVLAAFMRRLPPRRREDFPQYLEGLRLRPNAQVSDFALLGYSGAKLLSDKFSIIHPFNNVGGSCEVLLEAAGYSHIQMDSKAEIQIDNPAFFSKEFNNATQEDVIRVSINNERHIGYVNKGLIPTVLDWIEEKRIEGAWVEKVNGSPGKPTVYLYVKVFADK